MLRHACIWSRDNRRFERDALKSLAEEVKSSLQQLAKGNRTASKDKLVKERNHLKALSMYAVGMVGGH